MISSPTPPPALDASASLALTASPAPAPPKDWGLARRIGFRFAFAYLVLYLFPFPVDVLPGAEPLSNAVRDVWHTVVPWVGKHVLRLDTDITVFTNGSGDTRYDYVHAGVLLLLAGVATALVSVVDRRRTQYARAHDVLRMLVRYSLAVALVAYGMSKLTKMQFPYPSMARMAQPLGEFSPMGLLWTFMGYSRGYNLFAGAAEALGGLLLFFRRTTTLGALVVSAVMANVVALNFFYDVPVKLYSSHLLLMAVFLLLPELGRLADVLVFNRPTQARELGMPFALSRRMRWGVRAAKASLVGWVLYSTLSTQVEGVGQYGDSAPRSPLHGLYEVERFTTEGQELPALPGGKPRWQFLAVNSAQSVSIRWSHGPTVAYMLAEDGGKKTLTFTQGPESPGVFTYTQPDAEHLVLQGKFYDLAVEAHLRKVAPEKLLLMNRGFNWIQDRPFNR